MLPGFPPRRPSPDADVRLADLKAVVIDLETTGLYPNSGDEIIELGAAYVNGYDVLSEKSFESLVDPKRPVSPDAFRVHNITDAQLQGQPTIGEILPAFMGFVGDRVLVGQNVVFDLSFLEKSLRLEQLPAMKNCVLDTRWLSQLVFPRTTQHGLDAIGGRLNITRPADRHRALGDVLYTAHIFVELLKRLRSRGYESLGDLLEAYEKLEMGHFGDGSILEILRGAFAARRQVEIAYAGTGYNSESAEQRKHVRTLDIYYLSPPYLIGYCHNRNAIRTFRLDRISRVTLLDTHYTIPADFHPGDHFMRWTRSS
jgi:DNA polymerase III epsilon subunit family exonuclease